MTKSFNKPAFSKNNGSKRASSRNDNIRPTFGKNDNNGKIDRFSSDGIKNVKKLKKSKKLAKSKKTLKSSNLSNFGAKETKLSVLTLGTKMTFNHLRLAFTKALIF